MRKAILLFLVLFIVCGCSAQETAGQLEIKDTVRTYNRLLNEGYKSLNMAPLNRVATQRRTVKAYHHMAALGEGGIRMEARIEQIQFLKVTRYSPEKAEVQTRERWNCYYYNIESGEQVSENIITYENILLVEYSMY